MDEKFPMNQALEYSERVKRVSYKKKMQIVIKWTHSMKIPGLTKIPERNR